ncbi:MAG: cytochrome c maturation protein CcmE [Pseudomonadota bacterium]|jgi:cytochrome c-type biogenesis protein CcmE
MSILPTSRKARRRLMAVGVAAPILGAAVALSLYAMGDAAVFFYSPSQAQAKHVPAGRLVRIGGLVEKGSVVKTGDGRVSFTVTDNVATDKVTFKGELPDLFREGQGVVTQGRFRADGVFEAQEVLAKHDEKYMPREVSDALKKSGHWQGEGQGAAQAGAAPTGMSAAGSR